MRSYPVVNLLGQAVARPAPAPQVAPDPFSQAGRQRLPCPPVKSAEATRTCVQTRDGGVICSDNVYYPQGCEMPSYDEGEYATYRADQGFLFPVPPKPASLTAETGSSFPIIAFAIAAMSYVISIVTSD